MSERNLIVEHDVIDKIILTEKEIQQIIQNLARQIGVHYGGTDQVVVLTVLEGASVFSHALGDTLFMPPNKFEFYNIIAQSYYGTISTNCNPGW